MLVCACLCVPVCIYIWHLALVQRYWHEAGNVKLLTWGYWVDAVGVKLLTWSCWREAVDAKLLTWSCCTLTWSYWREASFLTTEAIWNQSLRKRWNWPVSQGPDRRTYRSQLLPFPLSRLKLVRESLSDSLRFSLSVCLSDCLSVSLSVCLCVSLSLSTSGFLTSWSGSVSSPSSDNPAAILQMTTQILVPVYQSA